MTDPRTLPHSPPPSDRTHPFSVYAVKDGNRRTLFYRYRTRREAEGIVMALAEIGCRADIVEPFDELEVAP